MMRARVLSCLLIVLSLSAMMMADDVKLRNSPLTPAAAGDVDYHHDRNGNTSMELKVDRLAAPSSLQTPGQVYVVWVQAPGQSPQNKGVLKVNNDLKGSLKMTTPYKSFDIFVTSEQNSHVTQPSGPEVLRGSIQNQ